MKKTNFKGYAITVSDEDKDVSKAKWKDARKHWRVTVKKDGKQISYDNYGGSMAVMPPLIAFQCYLSDGVDYMNNKDFHDFCDEFGYTTYDRRAKDIFHACEKAYFKLRKFVGTDDEILKLLNEINEEYEYE